MSCRYAIDRYTDPDRQFAIDGNGLVTTAKLLDREDRPGHRVHILAIDKGQPALTVALFRSSLPFTFSASTLLVG